MNSDDAALRLHEEHKGKLEVRTKVPLDTKEDLTLAYTPGVAAPCKAIAERPEEVFRYTMKGNTVAVVTDGSAVLGLGNIGASASLPVMEGKCALFKRFAGIDAFPIALATQDPDEIVRAVELIAPVFGGINLEDISAPRCIEIERRLVARLPIPVFHDDQHGTAVVVLAGLLNALKVVQKHPSESRIVVSGAGAAGSAIVRLLHSYGVKDIILTDSKGIVSTHRPDITGIKRIIASFTNLTGACCMLYDALKGADVFIGVSKPGVLKKEMIANMGKQPIVFALANPVPEISREDAIAAGASVVATGRSDVPNQLNNVLAFPGIFRGALDFGVRKITPGMLVAAAEAIAGLVPEPHPDLIIPSPFDARVVPAVREAVRNVHERNMPSHLFSVATPARG